MCGWIIDAHRPHLAHQGRAEHCIKVTQQPILAYEQLDTAAQLVKSRRQLTGDVTAAGDRDAVRPPFEGEKSVRSDAAFRSRKPRHGGSAAAGDHDVRRFHAGAVHLHGVRIEEPGGTPHQGDVFGRQIALVDAVQTDDIGVATPLQGAPVIAADRDVEAIIARIGERHGDARRIPHDLLGNATDVHAGAAERAGFDYRHPGAVARRLLGTSQAAAAAADADEIENFAGHCELHPDGGLGSDDKV